MNAPENGADGLPATGTSAEGRSAHGSAHSPRNAAIPPMWWSRSAGEWFVEDPEDGICSFGTFRSLSDSLPSDAQRLIPAADLMQTGELLGYLLGQYERTVDIHAQIGMDTEEDRDLHRRSVDAMRQAAEPVRQWIDDLAARAGTPDPTTRQGGGDD